MSTLATSHALLDVERRWSPLLHGLQVVAAREAPVGKTELVRADTRDLCVRVAFDASEAVVASLVDSTGATLTMSPESSAGLLARDGPICIRRGSALDALAKGPASAHVRWVAWGARSEAGSASPAVHADAATRPTDPPDEADAGSADLPN